MLCVCCMCYMLHECVVHACCVVLELHVLYVLYECVVCMLCCELHVLCVCCMSVVLYECVVRECCIELRVLCVLYVHVVLNVSCMCCT